MASRRPSLDASRRTPPAFYWQGLLIVLPVVLLAGAGFHSLRQDRRLARHEATAKAQSYADEAARLLWLKLSAPAALEAFKDHTFRVDARGKVLHPPPAGALPPPQPLDLTALDEGQRESWLAACGPDGDAADRARAIAACRQFNSLNPPESFTAAAQFRLGLLLAADGNHAEAATTLQSLLDNPSSATTESGLPLAPLVQFKLIQIAARADAASSRPLADLVDSFCSNLVAQPTFLTPLLFAEAAAIEPRTGGTNLVERWLEEWERHEALRPLAAAACKQFTASSAAPNNIPPGASNSASVVPALFWFQARDLGLDPQPIFPPGRQMLIKAGGFAQNSVASVAFSDSAAATSLPAPAQRLGPRDFPWDVEWLATRLSDRQGGFWVVCRAMGVFVPKATDSTITSPAWLELRESLPPLPDWFDYSLDVAGVMVKFGKDLSTLTKAPSGKAGGPRPNEHKLPLPAEVLASARHFEDGTDWLRINVHLVAPERLFAAQRTRTRLFGLLIGLSALTAVIGFASAWRAFARQEQLAEMKSNFVSSVSHELRAPIASVRLLAESLDRGKVIEPSKQREYFRFIVQECRRLSTLIENVLDFARIEQGRKQYEFEPTDLPALIRQTVKLMEPAATEREVTLQLDVPDESPAALSPSLDGAAIQQALVNLIDNAVKHAPAGTVVAVSLQFDTRHSAFSISVTDHGPGIPAAEHDRIFERFYRRGSELRRETQGVGIGLSIVKHVVEAHRGRVTVQSEVGQGSRFTLELPLEPQVVNRKS